MLNINLTHLLSIRKQPKGLLNINHKQIHLTNMDTVSCYNGHTHALELVSLATKTHIYV